MRSTAEHLATSPRLVASLDATPAERRSARDAAGKLEFAEKLLRNMQVVKRARFNAHQRLEAKHTASVAAFTLATVIEIAISLFTIVYDQKLAGDLRAFLEFASIVTAVFLFGFGLVVGLANYQTRALYLQRCALEISNLADEMQIALPLTVPELQEFRRRYHEIEASCPVNHEPVDLERALAKPSDAAAQAKARRSQRIDIYGPYALASIAYLTVWITFWLLVRF